MPPWTSLWTTTLPSKPISGAAEIATPHQPMTANLGPGLRSPLPLSPASPASARAIASAHGKATASITATIAAARRGLASLSTASRSSSASV